jgi:hypothetical protein
MKANVGCPLPSPVHPMDGAVAQAAGVGRLLHGEPGVIPCTTRLSERSSAQDHHGKDYRAEQRQDGQHTEQHTPE